MPIRPGTDVLGRFDPVVAGFSRAGRGGVVGLGVIHIEHGQALWVMDEEQRWIAHRVFWQDKRWFEQHPDARRYRRPYVPGEFTDGETNSELRRRLQQAVDVEVWWSTAAASNRPPLRFRRVSEIEVTWTDPEDAVNWMLRAGPPRD